MQFVVLHHTAWPAHPAHYDLMLQMKPGLSDADPVLKTFATLTDEFPDGKSHADARARKAGAGDPVAQANLLRLIADHRRAYLSFEGALSADRGRVVRVEAGALNFLGTPDAGLQELRFHLEGQILRGDYRLRHMGGGTYAFERMRRV